MSDTEYLEKIKKRCKIIELVIQALADDPDLSKDIYEIVRNRFDVTRKINNVDRVRKVLEKSNTPLTATEISIHSGMPIGNVSNVLYKTGKDEFESTGERKKRLWSIKKKGNEMK